MSAGMKDARAPSTRDQLRRSGGMLRTGSTPAPQRIRTEPMRKTGAVPLKRTRTWRMGLLLVVAAGVSALAVVEAARLARSADALPLRSIAVVGVDGPLAEEVRAYAELAPGVPLLSLDLSAVAARVAEHPYVASAAVRRLPPDTVEIAVRARTAALVVASDAAYLVDADGKLFKRARAGDGLDLPVLTGIDAATLGTPEGDATVARVLAVVRGHAAAGAPGGALSEVHVSAPDALELVLADGTRVVLGATDGARLAEKLARLDVVTRELTARGQQAATIRFDDDRRPERAAVRLRTGMETAPAGGTKSTSRERGEGATQRERQSQEAGNGTKEGSPT
jgi:cell division protein FtsQ